jgi:hypothetical protein
MTLIVVVVHIHLISLVFKMATAQQRSWCVLQLAKKESVTDVQRALRRQLHMESPSTMKLCEKSIAQLLHIKYKQIRIWK